MYLQPNLYKGKKKVIEVIWSKDSNFNFNEILVMILLE